MNLIRRLSLRIAGVLGLASVLVMGGLNASGSDERPIEAPIPDNGGPDPLSLAARAPAQAEKQLESAVGVGVFENYIQSPGDEKPSLRTRARVHVHFDRGKYHLRFDFDRMLVPTTYTDGEGNRTERVVDWKPDDLVVIYDGDAAHCVQFSRRINPTGCEVRIWPSLGDACTSAAGLPWGELARLWMHNLHVERLIENVGRDAIQVSTTKDGKYLGTYHAKNSPTVRSEFLIDPASGFHVTEEQIFNGRELEPARTRKAIWDRKGGVWFVERFEEVSQRRGANPHVSRAVFQFESFDVNPKVDPGLFNADAVPVPPGTRTIDQRTGEIFKR